MPKVKAHELKDASKTPEQLLKQLDELRNELIQLRVAKVCGGAASKLSKIKIIRKSIATVLTVYNTQRRHLAKEGCKEQKYISKDLRVKKTRSWRRKLTPIEACKTTLKQSKKVAHLPRRKFAVKVD